MGHGPMAQWWGLASVSWRVDLSPTQWISNPSEPDTKD